MAITLADVESAINTILTSGQAVTVDGITYTAANLKTLQDMRAEIQKEALNTAKTRPAMRAFNFGSMAYATNGDGATPTPVTPNLP
jgi:hypothetical protein